MRSLRHRPQPPLSAFVDCLWYWESAPQTHTKERLLPNGEAAIIFNLLDGPIRIYDAQNFARFSTHRHATFSGPRSNCFVIDTDQQERVIGIEFRPGGAFPFLRMPASELEGNSFELDDLWPDRARDIRDRLLCSPTPEAMLATLERCLLAQLVRPLELHPAVGFALKSFCGSPEALQVASVTDRIGLSSRRFIELFRNQVGLAPKVFCRVRRFQRVLQAVHGSKKADWAQVALECGYYDQAHLIHDFRSISGLTPGAYLASATPHLNHVPVT